MKKLIKLIALTSFIVTGASPSKVFASAVQTDIPFEIVKGSIFVKVITPASRTPLRFILDTGCSWTTFEDVTARKLGLGRWGEAGVSGMANAPTSFVRGIKATCGGIPLNKSAACTSLINISLDKGHWVDGLLGTDFLEGKTVTFNFQTHRIHIESNPASNSLTQQLFGRIPFCSRTNAVWVTVNSQASRRPLTFLLDTGASKSVISTRLAREMNLPLQKSGTVCVVGGKLGTWKAENFNGRVGGHQLATSVMAMNLEHEAWSYSHHMDGIVGMDFLNSKDVNVDFGSHLATISGHGCDNPGFAGTDEGMVAASGKPVLSKRWK